MTECNKLSAPEGDTASSAGRRSALPRRLTLLASAAGLGIAVLVAGPAGYQHLSQPAVAAEAASRPSGFADLVAKVKPAVISVRVRVEDKSDISGTDRNSDRRSFGSGSPFDRFFRQFGSPNVPNGTQQHRRVVMGEGSGFFISSDGYAVTNYHVVDHAESVQVTTDSGKKLPAKVIGADQKTDLALIKVDGNDFPHVRFADQAPRIGDWVLAIGNPFGLGGTVTAGIVSASGRDIGSGPYNDYIQIDAPINRGNSGGPAFDINGNVVGVNTAIYSPSGGSVGIGFDIPADTVKTVIAQLKDKGSVTRGWLGVQIQTVTQDIADGLGMTRAEGALVDQPQANSPAAKAGLKEGDVITAVNGNPVKDSRDLARKIAALAPGTSIKIDVLQSGEQKTVMLTLGTVPAERQARAQAGSTGSDRSGNIGPYLGLMLAPAADVAGAGNSGAVVTGIDPNGAAAERGIQTGDVIQEIGGHAVSGPADVRKDLAELRKEGKHTALMRVESNNGTKFVALPLKNA